VGEAILRLLLRLGERVTVVTPTEPSGPVDGAVRLLVGNARDDRLLEEAGLLGARALIAATDDDLANVAIALHARKAAPTVPVVVRLFDQDLASHLKEVVGVRGAFSASSLSAPAFVAAALGDSTLLAFEAEGEAWVVEELPAGAGEDAGDAGEAGEEQVTIGHRAGGRFVEAPAGSRGGPDAGRPVVLARRRAVPTSSRRTGATLARGVRGAWTDMPRGLRFAVYGMLVLVASSIGIFRAVLRLPLVDAYYFVITTITTTGYGDISLQAAPAWVKVYGTLVMISGCALFAVLFSVITDVLLRTRLGDVMARGAAQMEGHVVVAGMGNVGIRVLRELGRHGEDLVVVQKDEEGPFGPVARTLAPVVVGDAGAAETLRRAGVPGARTVLALTNDDLTNLSVAVASRRLNPSCRVVARVLDGALSGRLSEGLGIDAVVSPADAAAPTFVAAALEAGVVRGFVLGDRLCLLVRRTIPAADAFAAPAESRPLLVRRGGKGPFEPVTGRGVAVGDEVIGVRWIEMRGGERRPEGEA